MTWEVRQCDALERLREMPDCSVHCCVTSPPYFGLRNYNCDGQIGLEQTPEDYAGRLVEVFREVRRVLRDDGTFWLNCGDSYAGGGGGNYSTGTRNNSGQNVTNVRNRPGWLEQAGAKAKDLLGVPWMLAFALRADGWYLRAECLWVKKSPMPESIKDRPTRAHEQIFLLAKSPSYYYDQEAERVSLAAPNRSGTNPSLAESLMPGTIPQVRASQGRDGIESNQQGRNLWKWWDDLRPQPYPEAHFATFVPDLPKRCIRLGTSERGVCPGCGAPWERVVEREKTFESGSGRSGNPINGKNGACLQGGGDTGDIRKGPVVATKTLGWVPSCACDAGEPIPATVLDPFSGAATTGIVAYRLHRSYVGCELNPEYVRLSYERWEKEKAKTPLFSD